MAIRFLRIVNAKQALRRALMVSEASTVPKEHLAVYVGEIEKSRFVVPVSYLKHPSFQNLLSQAEEEFVENTSYENSTADTDDKVACHFSYTRLKTEYVEDLLSWQNGITEESQ